MLNINIINAFEDNYLFLLSCDITNEIAVIDPGDAHEIINALNGKRLNKIFVTHHHNDHVGGIEELVQKYDCEVFAFEDDVHRIPCVSNKLAKGSFVSVGKSTAEVMHVPGHTTGHMAYYFENDKALFCGDTMFVGGCGRLFEGASINMFNSLVELYKLPDETSIYCAHEYTVDNLKFACMVKPDDVAYEAALNEATRKRREGKRTVPSTICAEKQHNIFVRAKTLKEFESLRKLKDIN